jgi:hypothetical protein
VAHQADAQVSKMCSGPALASKQRSPEMRAARTDFGYAGIGQERTSLEVDHLLCTTQPIQYQSFDSRRTHTGLGRRTRSSGREAAICWSEASVILSQAANCSDRRPGHAAL